MQLFYNPELTTDKTQFTFSQEESKHIVKVLRKKIGDTLYLTNGKGYLFKSRITAVDPKNCMVTILTAEKKPERTYKLHMAVAPTKMNDRFEWFLEKATEIGVDEITPLLCENSERRTVKQERMEKVVQAATKQSLQTYIPTINKAITFTEFIALSRESDLFIAHCAAGEKPSLKSSLTPNKNTIILIGPEGDFSPSEIEIALKKGFQPISLGATRLRTETAAMVACTAVALANE